MVLSRMAAALIVVYEFRYQFAATTRRVIMSQDPSQSRPSYHSAKPLKVKYSHPLHSAMSFDAVLCGRAGSSKRSTSRNAPSAKRTCRTLFGRPAAMPTPCVRCAKYTTRPSLEATRGCSDDEINVLSESRISLEDHGDAASNHPLNARCGDCRRNCCITATSSRSGCLKRAPASQRASSRDHDALGIPRLLARRRVR